MVYLDSSVISGPFLEIRDEHLKVVCGWVGGWWWVYLDYSVISGLFVSCQLSWTVKKEIEMRPLLGDRPGPDRSLTIILMASVSSSHWFRFLLYIFILSSIISLGPSLTVTSGPYSYSWFLLSKSCILDCCFICKKAWRRGHFTSDSWN